jgi:LETM1 and EF-hand domain-containing protein 1
VTKLDPDGDGLVRLEHVLGLVEGEGLGVVREEAALGDEVRSLVGEGREIKERRPRKEDIVADQ